MTLFLEYRLISAHPLFSVDLMNNNHILSTLLENTFNHKLHDHGCQCCSSLGKDCPTDNSL